MLNFKVILRNAIDTKYIIKNQGTENNTQQRNAITIWEYSTLTKHQAIFVQYVVIITRFSRNTFHNIIRLGVPTLTDSGGGEGHSERRTKERYGARIWPSDRETSEVICGCDCCCLSLPPYSCITVHGNHHHHHHYLSVSLLPRNRSVVSSFIS